MGHDVVVRQAGEGDAYWVLGGLYEVKVSSDETNGAMTVMQFTIPEGMGPPPHVHDGDETVTVMDGRAASIWTARHHRARTRVGDPLPGRHPGVLRTARPGASCRDLHARFGVDKFFAEAGEPTKSREIPPAPEAPPDIEQLAAVAQRHGLRLMPPSAP